MRDIPQKQVDFDSYFSDKIMLVAVFDKIMKHRLIEEYGIDSFSYTDDGNILFKFGFTSKENLLSWVLSFGDKVEVIEPRELMSEIKIQAQNMSKKYL